MPPFFKFLMRNALVGFAGGAIGAVTLIAIDFVGLRGLVLGSNSGLMAGGMLIYMLGLTFAGAQIGLAVFSMRRKETNDRPRGGRMIRIPTAEPALAPVSVDARRR